MRFTMIDKQSEILPKVHLLKITQHWFNELDNDKRFEVRKNDRGYRIGEYINVYVPDTLHLRSFRITYILTSEQFPDGIKDGYCILGIEETA